METGISQKPTITPEESELISEECKKRGLGNIYVRGALCFAREEGLSYDEVLEMACEQNPAGEHIPSYIKAIEFLREVFPENK